MATTVKGGGPGKEKRGTSPSSSTTMIKKSPKPLSTNASSSSSSPSDEKTNSPTDGKPVPNYLKPTISSSLDFSRLPKRPNTDSSAQKPALDRRRSFDRPPAASQVQKAIRGVPGPQKNRPLRSSSFSSKSSISSARPSSSDKQTGKVATTVTPAKEAKPGPQLSKSRSVKKSSLGQTTSTTSSGSKKDLTKPKKAPKSVTSESSVDYENQSVDHLCIDDDLVNLDHEVQSLPEISEMPESSSELGDPTNLDGVLEDRHEEIVLEAGNNDDLVHNDQEGKSTAADHGLEETATQEIGANDHHNDQTVEKQPVQETAEEKPDHQEEIQGAGQDQTEEDAGKQGEDDQEIPTTETIEEEKEEEKEEEEKGNVEESLKDEKETAAASTSTSASETPKTQSAAGKKENQAYNDVIEETATKLMGKKNKVLALAGAFETVISLQDNTKNN